jgi:hypothetical protein
MKQRTLKTAIGGRAVTVLMGWDKPLQYHFIAAWQAPVVLGTH